MIMCVIDKKIKLKVQTIQVKEILIKECQCYSRTIDKTMNLRNILHLIKEVIE